MSNLLNFNNLIVIFVNAANNTVERLNIIRKIIDFGNSCEVATDVSGINFISRQGFHNLLIILGLQGWGRSVEKPSNYPMNTLSDIHQHLSLSIAV